MGVGRSGRGVGTCDSEGRLWQEQRTVYMDRKISVRTFIKCRKGCQVLWNEGIGISNFVLVK